MAIAFRAATSTAPTTALSITVTKPSGTVDDDVMVVIISVSGTNTVTAPTGWVAVRGPDTSGTTRYWTFRKVAGASEPSSYDFDASFFASKSAICVAYSGVDGTTPVDVHGAQTGTTTTITAPSVTSSVNGCRVICFHAIDKSTTLTTPSGTTLRHEAESVSPSMQASDFNVATAGASGAKTSAAGASGSTLGLQVALTPGVQVLVDVWGAIPL